MIYHTERLKEYILCGQVKWPNPPPAAPSAAAIEDQTRTMNQSHNQNENLCLRSPCFYALFPTLWRHRPRESEAPMAKREILDIHAGADIQMRQTECGMGENTTSPLSADASISCAKRNCYFTPLAPASLSSSSSSNRHLRLRARSPSPLLTSGLLGSSSSRSVYDAEFTAAIISRTAHISGHSPGSGSVDGAFPLPPSLSTSDPNQGANGSIGPPSATVYRKHSRFNKPIADMGDYLSLIRSSPIPRDPLLDPLDDPQFAAHVAQQHSLVAAAAARDKVALMDEHQQQQGMNGGNGSMNSSSFSSSPSSSPRQPRRPSQSQSQSLSSRPTPSSPSASSTSSSSPSSPHTRLTVDEADDLTDAALLNSFNAGGGMSAPRRGRAKGKPPIPKPPFHQFILQRGNEPKNGSTAATSNSSTSSFEDSPLALSPSSSLSNPPVGSSSKVDARLLRHTRALEDAVKQLRQSQQSTPSIATLLASMDHTPTPSPSRHQRQPTVNEAYLSPPAVLAILYRLECELGTSLHKASRQLSSPTFFVYLTRVENWFIHQVKDLLRDQDSSPTQLVRSYEEAFHRWMKEFTQLTQASTGGKGQIPLQTIRWEKIVTEARGETQAHKTPNNSTIDAQRTK